MNKEVEKIRKEIERLAQVACNNAKGFEENRNERAVWLQQEDVCKRLLSFIDSLQEEPVSEELEEVAEKYAYTNWQSDEYHDGANKGLPFDAIGHTEKAFKEGAEWQKEKDNKIIVNMCSHIWNAYVSGKKTAKEEMMKNAIEREVKVDAGGYPYIDATELYDYENDKPLAKAGDRVKVVFIKDK